MKLSRQEVQHIALLARLGLSEDEIEKFRIQLSDILENFEILKQVDTADLPPTSQSIALQNVLRPDEAKASYPVEDILNNAPQREGNCFKATSSLMVTQACTLSSTLARCARLALVNSTADIFLSFRSW